MELNELKLHDKFWAKIINVNDEIKIIQIEDKEGQRQLDYYNVLYNYKTNEIIPLDKEKRILNKVGNTNYYIVLYKKVYLAELINDREINLIYKLDNDDGYKYMYAFGSEKGERIFIARGKFSNGSLGKDDREEFNDRGIKTDTKYSILEIQER